MNDELYVCRAAAQAYSNCDWQTNGRAVEEVLNEMGDARFHGWRSKKSNCGVPWTHLMTLKAGQFNSYPIIQDLVQCIEWLASHTIERYCLEQKTAQEHFQMEHILRTAVQKLQITVAERDKDLLNARTRLKALEEDQLNSAKLIGPPPPGHRTDLSEIPPQPPTDDEKYHPHVAREVPSRVSTAVPNSHLRRVHSNKTGDPLYSTYRSHTQPRSPVGGGGRPPRPPMRFKVTSSTSQPPVVSALSQGTATTNESSKPLLHQVLKDCQTKNGESGPNSQSAHKFFAQTDREQSRRHESRDEYSHSQDPHPGPHYAMRLTRTASAGLSDYVYGIRRPKQPDQQSNPIERGRAAAPTETNGKVIQQQQERLRLRAESQDKAAELKYRMSARRKGPSKGIGWTGGSAFDSEDDDMPAGGGLLGMEYVISDKEVYRYPNGVQKHNEEVQLASRTAPPRARRPSHGGGLCN